MKNYIITSEGEQALDLFTCPFCEASFESGFMFGGSDQREGGLAYCEHCNLEFAWINNPFECEVKEGASHEN